MIHKDKISNLNKYIALASEDEVLDLLNKGLKTDHVSPGEHGLTVHYEKGEIRDSLPYISRNGVIGRGPINSFEVFVEAYKVADKEVKDKFKKGVSQLLDKLHQSNPADLDYQGKWYLNLGGLIEETPEIANHVAEQVKQIVDSENYHGMPSDREFKIDASDYLLRSMYGVKSISLDWWNSRLGKSRIDVVFYGNTEHPDKKDRMFDELEVYINHGLSLEELTNTIPHLIVTKGLDAAKTALKSGLGTISDSAKKDKLYSDLKTFFKQWEYGEF